MTDTVINFAGDRVALIPRIFERAVIGNIPTPANTHCACAQSSGTIAGFLFCAQGKRTRRSVRHRQPGGRVEPPARYGRRARHGRGGGVVPSESEMAFRAPRAALTGAGAGDLIGVALVKNAAVCIIRTDVADPPPDLEVWLDGVTCDDGRPKVRRASQSTRGERMSPGRAHALGAMFIKPARQRHAI